MGYWTITRNGEILCDKDCCRFAYWEEAEIALSASNYYDDWENSWDIAYVNTPTF